MMRLDELVAAIEDLRREDLETWIHAALVAPREDTGAPVFDEMECARVRLICTLHYDMDIEVDTLPIIMNLIDQLNETRHQLHRLSNAVLAQDEDIRSAVLSVMKNR